MQNKVARVYIDIAHNLVDKPFEYLIPDELLDKVKVGSRVWVPFGRFNKSTEGYVVKISSESEWEKDKLKKNIKMS